MHLSLLAMDRSLTACNRRPVAKDVKSLIL
jgi:hypothetical protein